MIIDTRRCPQDHNVFLSIDLDVVRENYRFMRQASGSAKTAVVLKANAYGAGLLPVAQAVWQEGGHDFFVTSVHEGKTLKDAVPQANVYILNGVIQGTEDTLVTHQLVPVLLSLEQADLWHQKAHAIGKTLPAILQVDTGMGRFGLSYAELKIWAENPDRWCGVILKYLLSHLSSASLSTHPDNEAQLKRFEQCRVLLPNIPATFANSPGILLGHKYHFDMTRLGIALYGGAPFEDHPNPLDPTVCLATQILQVRALKKGERVGYDGTYVMPEDGLIATVNLGFGDGFPRTLSNRGFGRLGGWEVPIAGRISMDWMSFDITHVPAGFARPGNWIHVIDEVLTLDRVATLAQTTSYDLLSGLGSRIYRLY